MRTEFSVSSTFTAIQERQQWSRALRTRSLIFGNRCVVKLDNRSQITCICLQMLCQRACTNCCRWMCLQVTFFRVDHRLLDHMKDGILHVEVWAEQSLEERSAKAAAISRRNQFSFTTPVSFRSRHNRDCIVWLSPTLRVSECGCATRTFRTLEQSDERTQKQTWRPRSRVKS